MESKNTAFLLKFFLLVFLKTLHNIYIFILNIKLVFYSFIKLQYYLSDLQTSVSFAGHFGPKFVWSTISVKNTLSNFYEVILMSKTFVKYI